MQIYPTRNTQIGICKKSLDVLMATIDLMGLNIPDEM